jgi:cytochrome c oxidase subunit I+III
MRRLRPAGDLADLPTVTFGSKSLMFWGTLGFIVIEGWTMALIVVAYFYLRQNYETWPPLRTPFPSLLIPSINVAVMLVSCVPAYLVSNAAKQLDEPAVKRWLLVQSLAVVPTLVLRWWELWSLNTRWDTTAYGSAAWTIVGFHTSLLLLDVVDTLGLTLFYFIRKMPARAFSDATDNSNYWYFTVALWVAIYLLIYVGPRII